MLFCIHYNCLNIMYKHFTCLWIYVPTIILLCLCLQIRRIKQVRWWFKVSTMVDFLKFHYLSKENKDRWQLFTICIMTLIFIYSSMLCSFPSLQKRGIQVCVCTLYILYSCTWLFNQILFVTTLNF